MNLEIIAWAFFNPANGALAPTPEGETGFGIESIVRNGVGDWTAILEPGFRPVSTTALAGRGNANPYIFGHTSKQRWDDGYF